MFGLELCSSPVKLLAQEYLLDPEGVIARIQAEEERRCLEEQEREKRLKEAPTLVQISKAIWKGYWNLLDSLLSNYNAIDQQAEKLVQKGHYQSQEEAKKFLKFWSKVVITVGFTLFIGSCVSLSNTNSNQEVAKTPKLETTSSEPIAETQIPDDIIETPKAASQPVETNETSPPVFNKFNFTQDSCGDKSTGSNDTWYPVFINGGNLNNIRNKYCRDALSTVREQTQKPTVQVASFTDYQSALEFAEAVGGEVGEAKQNYSDIQEPSPTLSVNSEESTINSESETEQIDTNAVNSNSFESYGSFGTSSYSGSGRCNSPDDLDSRGRRCGARAAGVRSGGHRRRR